MSFQVGGLIRAAAGKNEVHYGLVQAGVLASCVLGILSGNLCSVESEPRLYIVGVIQ